MLFLLLFRQAVGIRAHPCRNSSSYSGDPKGRMVLVATSKTAGGLWGSSHAKYVNVLPLFGNSAFSNLLHSICDEGVKPACIIVDICLNYFAIGPEHFIDFIVSQLSAQHLAHFDGYQGSCQLKARYGYRFQGVKRAFPITSEQFTLLLVSTRRRYEHWPYPSVLASEKWCSSTFLRVSISFSLKHLVTSIISRKGSSFLHVSHCSRSLSGMGSSQPMLSVHNSCNIRFPRNRNGAAKPSGSYIELTVDRMPRLVSGLSTLRVMRNLKASLSMFHCTPSTRSGGSKSRFKSSYLISFARDSGGVDSTTSLLSDENL